ncbi:PIN-like domain-containing protein [Peribacillus sp. FSL R5-0717]|uniref:PIN-like domain-containing protein n=1 Tax=Peribacillus sp. FSL R5-0717 TaxID=2975308 RepID=UPI0030F5DA8D
MSKKIILEDSIIIFDSSSLLDVYRYSLTSSKRILNYLVKYHDLMWIPNQVKEEVTRNMTKVRSEHMNKYKNLPKRLKSEINVMKSSFINKLSNYKKYNFAGISDFETEIEKKFDEFNPMIEDYMKSLKEEEEIHKEYIFKEADNFLHRILSSDKVGEKIGLTEMIEIIREGELRYRYNIPPGYEDSGKEGGIRKFGDLFIWKEIIKKASLVSNKNIIFVLSDTKEDWFIKNDDTPSEEAREELLEEFKSVTQDKSIQIISMSNFIDEISDDDDKDLLVDLRKTKVVNKLSIPLHSVVEDFLDDLNQESLIDDLSIKASKEINEIFNYELNTVKIKGVSVKKEGEAYIYNLELLGEVHFSCASYFDGVASHGSINCNVICYVQIARGYNEEEKEFIEGFNKGIGSKPNHYMASFEDVIYSWGNDFDIDENDFDMDDKSGQENSYYSECGQCGGGINHFNDAGNGFCIKCTREFEK